MFVTALKLSFFFELGRQAASISRARLSGDRGTVLHGRCSVKSGGGPAPGGPSVGFVPVGADPTSASSGTESCATSAIRRATARGSTDFPSGDLEHQLVMHLQDQPRLTPLAWSQADTAIIAFLMRSAAVPCIGR